MIQKLFSKTILKLYAKFTMIVKDQSDNACDSF